MSLIIPSTKSFEPTTEGRVTVNDHRELIIPASLQPVGVEDDKDVERIWFEVPRFFDEDNDLSTFNMYINYINALGEPDLYRCFDSHVEGDKVVFSWLTDEHLYRANGVAKFKIKAAHADGRRWNSTIADLEILVGLNTEKTIIEQDYTFITQQFEKLDKLIEKVESGILRLDGANTQLETRIQQANATDTKLKATNTTANATNETLSQTNTSAEALLLESTTANTQLETRIQQANATEFTTKPEFEELKTVVLDEMVNLHGETWDLICDNLLLGRRAELYPLGTQFTVHNTVLNDDVVFEIIDYDNTENADGTQDEGILLRFVKCINGYMVDNWEAMYVAKQEMPAGTYHFFATKPYEENQNHPLGGNQSYQFTTTQPIPVGGIIMMYAGWQKPLVENKIEIWKDNLKSAKIETCTLSVGTGGTDLGTTDGLGELNHIDRFRFGNNNYAESGIRQWLNASGSGWWKPQNKWDVAPSYHNKDGLMGGFPEDFQRAICGVKRTLATNRIFENKPFMVNSSYSLENEKMFLLSRTELDYGQNNGVSEGKVLDKYRGLNNTEKVMYDSNGTARYDWTCSAGPWLASLVYSVYPSGDLYSNGACYGYAVSPACKIRKSRIAKNQATQGA